MSPRRNPSTCGAPDAKGVTGFLRSLMAGVPWSERVERSETVCVEAPSGGVFRIQNSNGRTRVIGEDRSDIQVVACKAGRAESSEAATRLIEEIRLVFHETPEGLDLEVEVPRKWNRRGVVHLEVSLPRHIHLSVAAVNGRVDIEGIHAPVRARSTNGSATITNVKGDVEVSTTNAKLCCECICGKLTARSSNGKIEIVEHRGSLNASTANGVIRASLEEIGKAGIQLATSNGRIVLELPDEVDAELDIRVDNGVIRNDRVLGQTTRSSNGRIVGRFGDGGPSIKLRTSNGSIAVR